MTQTAILFPSFAMFALSAAVLVSLAVVRYRAIGAKKVDPAYYALYQGKEETGQLRVLSRHVQNHFEVPPLLHIAVLLAFVTDAVTGLTVGLAWAFVIARAVHTGVHLGGNKVQLRFLVFIASVLILIALWASIFAALLQL